MAIQEIINISDSIEFNRRKSVGLQFSRSEIPKISETPTRNPWRLKVNVSAIIPYANARALIESIDNVDRRSNETITFSNNSNLSWVCAYRGQMTAGDIAGLTVSGFSGNQLVLAGLPTTPAFPTTNYLFRAGDFIQIAGFPHPFTVVNDVLRGSGSTVTITTHRPNFITTSVVGLGISVGNNVQFKMICTNMPTYSIISGKFVKFNDSFQLYEDTGAA